MKFTPIKGRLNFVGDSTAPATKNANRPNSHWTYASLVFIEDGTGDEITVRNCRVSGTLNRHMEPGEVGTFLIGLSGSERTLLGFRNDKYCTIDNWVLDPQGQYFIPGVLIVGGVLLTPLLIGLPVLAYGIYTAFTLGRLPKKLKKGLEDHGFTVRATRTV